MRQPGERLCVTVMLMIASAVPITAQSVLDSAGMRIVRYSQQAKPRATWTLGTRPLLEIGGDGKGATEFSAVHGVIRLSDGHVAVANSGTNEIRRFAANGTYERSFGRSGGGPGEFRRLTRLLRWGDTLIGVDVDSRAHVFDPSGTLLRSLQPGRRAGTRNPQRIGAGTSGTTYVVVTEGAPREEAERQVIMQTLTRSDVAGDSLSPIVTFPAHRVVRAGGVPSRLLLDAEGGAAAVQDRSCVGYSEEFVVTCYDRTNRPVLRVVRDVASREIHEAERALVRRAYLDANRDAPPAVRQQMERAVQEFRFASRAPAFSRLLLSTSGELWVGPFESGYGLPGPEAALVSTTAQTWNVFGADGTWLADVVVPPRFVLHEAGRDYLAGVAFDTDDVERVVVWALRR